MSTTVVKDTTRLGEEFTRSVSAGLASDTQTLDTCKIQQMAAADVRRRRKRTWLKRLLGWLHLAILMLALTGCQGGLGGFFKGIDDQCIAGKLTAAGARVLNETEGAVDWHDDYVELYGKASDKDRIFGGHCSAMIKQTSGAVSDAVD